MTWFCPTFGRPKELRFLADSWERTSPEEHLFIRLWEKDPCLRDYRLIQWPATWHFYISSSEWCGEALQEFFETFPMEKQYGFIGDDIILRTKGWNKLLSEAAGDWGFAYPDDSIQGKNLSTHGLFGGELLRAVGWWVLPDFKHHYLDVVWMNIAENCGVLNYVEKVKFEHRHYLVGKSSHDATYKKADAIIDAGLEAWNKNTGEITEAILRAKRALRGRHA